MQISHLTIDNPIIAAPMAGFSTRAFRDILRSQGAGVTYGEMISAQALCYKNRRTFELLDIADEAHPRVVQLFASDPAFIAEAARAVREMGADIIDINMGCPMPKIVNNGEGAALMRQPKLAAQLVEAAALSGLPVTVKLRSGFSENELNAPELARRLEAFGASLIAVHGRHREQYYQGAADWTQIAAVKRAVSIPVAGNGDIRTAQDALAMREQTGCDAVMIGRGLLGNPWLIAEIAALQKGGPIPPRPAPQEVLNTALRHLKAQAVRLPEDLAVRAMRGHLGYYVKGLFGAARLRDQINRLARVGEIEALFAEYLEARSEE